MGSPCYFFGYATDCAKMILCCGCNFRVLARAGLSTLARTTVASPSEAQIQINVLCDESHISGGIHLSVRRSRTVSLRKIGNIN